MSTVQLELQIKDVPNGMTYGIGPANQTIAERLCSDLEWPSIKLTLDDHKIAYKFANPTDSLLVSMHGANW